MQPLRQTSKHIFSQTFFKNSRFYHHPPSRIFLMAEKIKSVGSNVLDVTVCIGASTAIVSVPTILFAGGCYGSSQWIRDFKKLSTNSDNELDFGIFGLFLIPVTIVGFCSGVITTATYPIWKSVEKIETKINSE